MAQEGHTEGGKKHRVSKELPDAYLQHCPPCRDGSAREELCEAGGGTGVPAHTRRVLQEGTESRGQRRPPALWGRAVPKLGRWGGALP